MFCRILLNNIYGYSKDKNEKEITQIQLLKNSKNKILHFSLNRKTNEVNFEMEKLLIRKIPKKNKSVLNKNEVYFITFEDNKPFIIQPISELSVLIEEDGMIVKKKIQELSEGDSVLFYDQNLNDYYLIDVMEVNSLGDYDNLFIENSDEKEEDKAESIKEKKKEQMSFDDYIIGAEQHKGLVVNDLLLI